MDVLLVTGILALFLFLLLKGVPVAFALGLSGAAGILLLRTGAIAGDTIARVSYSSVARASLIVIPLFVLLGGVAAHARIASDAYQVLDRVGRRLPGSVAIATVFACAAFAAVTGSSAATVAALGKSSVAEMVRYGFTRHFSAGVIAAAGTLGVLIPPSLVLVLYGVISGEPIGELFIAGIVPGLLSATVYAVMILGLVRWTPRFTYTTGARRGVDEQESRSAESLPGSEYVGLLGAALIFAVVIGGIFFGFFTVTESAAIGVLVATMFLLGRNVKRPRQVASSYLDAARDAASTTGMIFAILVGASIFTFFLVSVGVPTAFTDWALALNVPPLVIVAIILLAFVPLGAILDGISVMLIVVPLTYPVITALGFDGIWFGILVVKMLEFGFITPPVGINAYIVSGVVPGVKVEEVFRGLGPFYLADAAVVLLIFFAPAIVSVLPGLMRI